MIFVAIYDFSNFFVPDVIEGDSFHDLMASLMKLMAKNKKKIAMPDRTIGMTLIILKIRTLKDNKKKPWLERDGKLNPKLRFQIQGCKFNCLILYLSYFLSLQMGGFWHPQRPCFFRALEMDDWVSFECS